MAAEKDDVNSKEENAKKSAAGSKKNLIILAVLAVVLVGLSVGGTIAVLKIFGGTPQAESDPAAETEVSAPAKKPAIYYPLKPDLLVTYLARGRHRYAQVGITLMLREEDVIAAVELHKPMIMNAMNMVFSGQLYEDLQTAEGKELVRVQCLEELQRIMQQEIGKPGIEQVLFTDFVMQ